MTLDPHAADYCPCCGQPREVSDVVQGFGLVLDCGSLRCGDEEVMLTPSLTRFARLLIQRGRVSHELLVLTVAPEAETNFIRVYARRFRLALQKIGAPAELKTIHSWGYELAPIQEQRAA